MSKYLVVYRASASAPEQMANASPEEAKAGMDAWMAWAGKAGSAIVEMGTPLALTGVLGAATAPPATNGVVGGFSILQADSADELNRVLDGHPHLMLGGASIEMYEFLEMPVPS